MFMKDQIERWAKNKAAEGWRESIANTPVENYGVTIYSGRDRAGSILPQFIENIEKAFQQLSIQEQEVIYLEYFEPGMQSEKAACINISHQLFRDRLYRARKKLNLTDKCY